MKPSKKLLKILLFILLGLIILTLGILIILCICKKSIFESFNSTNINFQNDIIICSLVRDSKSTIINNLKSLEKIGSKFKNYKFIIIENDSTDNTDQLLKKWSKNKNNIKIISEKMDHIINPTLPEGPELKSDYPLSKRRFHKMALLRNKYMDILSTENTSSDTWIMVVDLDIKKIPVNDTLISLKKLENNNWDAICSNGLTSNCIESPGSEGCKIKRKDNNKYSRSYDSLATRFDDNDMTNNFIIKEAITSKQIRDKWMKYESKCHKKTNNINKNPINVKSCFGGLAVYKANKFKNLRYDGNSGCEHISIYKQLTNIKLVPSFNIYYD